MLIEFNGRECFVRREKYTDGNNAIVLETAHGEIVAVASINIDGLKIDEVAIKDYSENEGMLETLLHYDIISVPIRYEYSGFVEIPVCKILI